MKSCDSYAPSAPRPKSAPISASFGKQTGQAAAAMTAPTPPIFSRCAFTPVPVDALLDGALEARGRGGGGCDDGVITAAGRPRHRVPAVSRRRLRRAQRLSRNQDQRRKAFGRFENDMPARAVFDRAEPDITDRSGQRLERAAEFLHDRAQRRRVGVADRGERLWLHHDVLDREARILIRSVLRLPYEGESHCNSEDDARCQSPGAPRPVFRTRTKNDPVCESVGHRARERVLQTLVAFVDAACEGGAARARLRVRSRPGRKAARIGELFAMEFEAVHLALRRLPASLNCWRSAWRARVRRVITAPSLVPSRAAISAQLKPPST